MSTVIAFPGKHTQSADATAPIAPASLSGGIVDHAGKAAHAMDQGLREYLKTQTLTMTPQEQASILSMSGCMLLANFFYDCGGRTLEEFDLYLTHITEAMRLQIERRAIQAKRGEG